MTILRDLYLPRRRLRPREKRSGEDRQQGQVTDPPLLDSDAIHRQSSEEARVAMEGRFGECLFLADWMETVFLHFEVDASLLQRDVPFPLDLHEGQSFVSFVAFTLKKMRISRGGRLTRWLTSPISTHRFLNLRTYVCHRGQAGIFFQKEWLDNRLAVHLGPATFGLPYHYAALEYKHAADFPTGRAVGERGCLRYCGKRTSPPASAKSETLDAFLLERYTAYANAGRRPQYFRVWHAPWKQTALRDIELKDTSLLDGLDAPWVKTARLACGHFSPGVEDVWMGRPHFAI